MAATANAAVIEFDLRAEVVEDIDGSNSFDYTVDGVTARLFALPETYLDSNDIERNPVLNRTSSSFGVNVEDVEDTGGCSSEDSDALDNGCLQESILVWLGVDATLVSIDVSSFSSSDSGKVSFQENGLNDIDIDSTGTTGISQFLGGSGDGYGFIVSYESGNGFSFDGFTIETVDVPEPSSFLLLGLGLFSLFYSRRI